jgi:hypothetical protein
MKTLIPRRPGNVALGDVAFPAGVPILGATVNEGIPGPISGTYYSHYYLTIVRRWRRHVVNHDHIWRTEPRILVVFIRYSPRTSEFLRG